MKIEFYKYQGTGNDFVMIDNRDLSYQINTLQIAQLCDRRYGVGGDGLILLQNKEGYDFEMVYYNSDGNESTMCGNGGRCIVQFAHDLNIIQDIANFIAIDGNHFATIENQKIKLQMIDVTRISQYKEAYQLNTGSPHLVYFENGIEDLQIVHRSRPIRYSVDFPEGININFVEKMNEQLLKIRTYERGVEDETYSCGTGVCASALAYSIKSNTPHKNLIFQTKGGILEVEFERIDDHFKNIFLIGPAAYIFKGEINI